MDKLIEQAYNLLSAADDYKAEIILYEIRMGTSEGRMSDDGSLTRYCEKCIDNAIQEKKKSYFIDRQKFMGKIFEYETYGYYIEPQYKFSKGGKVSGVVLKKVQSKEDKTKVIKYLKQKLKKDYPKSMRFKSECFNVCCSEYDGFENCDGCGVIFEQALLLTSQELEHWLGIEDSEYAAMIKDPYHAYQLRKIVDHWHPGKYADRIIEIAKKVLSVSMTNQQQPQ